MIVRHGVFHGSSGRAEDHHEKIADPDMVQPPPYYPDHPLVRLEWARYLNSISGMDKTVGKILKRLEADGLAENTIVMFFGDNGRIEPRGIHWCYDTGLHVPLIIRWARDRTPPPGFQSGQVDEQVVSLIDMTPTTLWCAGLARPLGMHGRIFSVMQVGKSVATHFQREIELMRQSIASGVFVVLATTIFATIFQTDTLRH